MRGAVDAASFFLQSDFADDLAVVDVRMQVALSSRLTLRGGLYKTPFSQSVLTFRGHLPLLERPRMVDALAPQRQLGGHLAFDAVPRRLLVEGGLYNGNGDTLSPNDNNSFLYIGRVSGAESLAFATVQWGLNAGYSHDTNVEIPRTAAAFAGTRILFGGDVTLRTQRWRVLGEIIGAHLDATNGAERSPLGLAIVGGVTPAEHHEVVVRYDRYNPDAITPTPNDIWELGYTYTPNAFLKTRVHYAASDDSLGNGAWTVRLQMVVN